MSAPRPGCGLYIKWINEAIAAEANRNLKRHNLTMSQCHVLMALFRREERSASLKELEGMFGVSQPTMAGLAARLEAKGLITGFADPRDRRVKLVRLTEAGLTICQASHQEIMATEERITDALSSEERALFLDMLRRIHDSLRLQP